LQISSRGIGSVRIRVAASFHGAGGGVVVVSLFCASDRGFPRTFPPALLSACACGGCWLSKIRPLGVAAAPAVSCLSTLDERPVGAAADVRCCGCDAKPLPRRGLPSDQVINELAVAVDGGLYGVASGRFFAWVVGGSLPAYVKSETF